MKPLSIRPFSIFVVFFLFLVGLPLAASAQVTAITCNAQQREDIEAVSNQIQARWTTLEKALEDRLDQNIKGCMRRRFQGRDSVGDKGGNGEAICVQSTPAPGMEANWAAQTVICNSADNGFGLSLSGSVLLCPMFLNRMANNKTFSTSSATRRACYAALLVHEFYHSCFRNLVANEKSSSNARIAERVAFRFWRDEVKGGAPNAVKIASAEDCF